MPRRTDFKQMMIEDRPDQRNQRPLIFIVFSAMLWSGALGCAGPRESSPVRVPSQARSAAPRESAVDRSAIAFPEFDRAAPGRRHSPAGVGRASIRGDADQSNESDNRRDRRADAINPWSEEAVPASPKSRSGEGRANPFDTGTKPTGNAASFDSAASTSATQPRTDLRPFDLDSGSAAIDSPESGRSAVATAFPDLGGSIDRNRVTAVPERETPGDRFRRNAQRGSSFYETGSGGDGRGDGLGFNDFGR